MAINIIIEEATAEIVAGIPKYLTIITDIPCAVFYTFDNTDPTTDSDILTSTQLKLPTIYNPLYVKLWATNGDDSSVIVSLKYENTLVGARIARADVTNYTSTTLANNNYYPFGDSVQPNPPHYSSQVGTITNNANQTPTDGYGFDANGNPVYTLDAPPGSYTFIYSTSDRIGQTGRGIGTLPAEVTIRVSAPPPETSSTNDKFFNARALVIYQDSADIENQDVTILNRRLFDLDDPRVRPTDVTTSAMDAQVRGGALRPNYNPVTNELIYSYRDAKSNRWIFSKEKLQTNSSTANTANIILSPRNRGTGLIFNWYPFQRRRIV